MNIVGIPLKNLFERFYTPNLLGTLLQGGALPEPDVEIKTLAKPPTVKITFDAVRNLVVGEDVAKLSWKDEMITVKITAEYTEDAIDEIRLYLNGKLINSSDRNLVVVDANNKKSLTKSFSVELAQGINSFKAIALNKQRTESQPDETDVNYVPSQNVPTPLKTGFTLYLVIVGINNYKNPKCNLNYAKADAVSFKAEMEKTKSIFTNTKAYFIADEDALKAGISQALNTVVKEVKPNDLFVFYWAGHGVISDSDHKKEFYIVPHDVNQLYGADDALSQKGISAKEWQEFSKKSRRKSNCLF